MPRKGPYLIEKVLNISRDASNKNQNNIKRDLQLTGIITSLSFLLTGTMTATGGGAVAAFTREAPLGIMTLLDLSGNFRRKGQKRTIVSMDPTMLYWPTSLLAGQPGEITIASSGAGQTDPIRGLIPDIVKSPTAPWQGLQYIDTRLYTSLDLLIQWGADSLLAATNLSSIDSEVLKVIVTEMVGELPPPSAAHFEPFWVTKRMLTESTDTKVDNDNEVTFDGIISDLFMQQDDASASGNSKRVDGLVKRVTVMQGGLPVFNQADTRGLVRKTKDAFPLGLTTSYPAGIIGLPMKPQLDSRDGILSVSRDTRSTGDAGDTDVTATTGDTLTTTVFGGEPNPAMARFMGVR